MSDLELVSQFLSAKGFTGALRALEAESVSECDKDAQETELEKIIKRSRFEATVNDQPIHQHQQIAGAAITDSAKAQPSLYADEYALLVDWISCSLERHKPELLGCLFPLFVHCYFNLVRFQPERSTVALNFLQRWGLDHAEAYCAEVRALGAISRREDLESLELTTSSPSSLVSQTALQSLENVVLLQGPNRHRLRVSIDTVSHELLKSFLVQNKLLLLMGILNEHVDVVVEDRDPRPMMAVVTSSAPDSTVPANSSSTDIAWGVLPLPLSGGSSTGGSAAAASSFSSSSSSLVDQVQDRPEFTFLGGGTEEVPYPALFVNPDKPSVADAVSRARLHPPPAFPPDVGFSSATRDAAAVVANANEPSVLLASVLNSSKGLTSLKLTQDATMMAAGFSDRVIRVWRLDQRGQSKRGDASSSSSSSSRSEETEDGAMELKAHAAYGLDFCAEQRHLISAGTEGGIRLWDLKPAGGQAMACYRAHRAPVWDVNFSPAGHLFLSASHDQTARLWCTDRAQPLRMLVGHYSDVTCCRFHGNGNYAATGSCDKTCRIWDLNSGKCVRVFHGHFDTVSALAMCPSGRYVATASEDSTVRVWDVGTGRQAAVLSGHRGPVNDVSYSVEGSTLASAGADCMVRTWDLAGAFEAATAKGERECAAPLTARHCFRTKSTPAVHVRWTRRNLLLAGGAFELS